MLRELKFWILGALLAMTSNAAFAFALYGPLAAERNPDWQTGPIGYKENAPDDYGADIGTPRKVTEEYRWNTPILYYAFDPSFEIFGSNGMAAIDQAMAILNSLGTASSYSAQLNEVPLDTSRFNFQASALGLVDLKSWTLSLMMEELGLANAERWTWALHDRAGPAGGATCPAGMSYEVTKLNFDPVTFNQSSYVNGALFSYRIIERCQAPPGTVVLADAFEFPVDPLTASTAVASAGIFGGVGLGTGAFFTGLTRDDVGGLRYLLRTNNMNTETVDAAAVQTGASGTNGSIFVTITTSNLADLVQIAATNNPAQLLVLFPDIVITSVSQGPQGFIYVFANVVTNSFFTRGTVSTATISAFLPPFSSPGDPLQLRTNTQNTVQNFINGDYFVIPTNICSFAVVSVLSTNVIPITTITFTNGTATNVNGQILLQTVITYFTNHTLLVRETPCPTNTGGGTAATPELRQGIEKITFIRRDFDSILGQFWAPATTNYVLHSVLNGQVVAETFQRTTTQPDFLFTVQDRAGDPGDTVLTYDLSARSIPNFVRVGGNPLIAGPGIIQASASIVYNNVGVVLQNTGPTFVDEGSASQLTRWGSYDGTTNAPIAYPDGFSLQNLENHVLMQITPDSLPNGAVGVPYNAQLGGNGGTQPYTFSIAPGSAGLPPGLTLSADGMISGTPQFDDTYDFAVRLTDFGQRQVDKPFSITISP